MTGILAAGGAGGLYMLSLKEQESYDRAVFISEIKDNHSKARTMELIGHGLATVALTGILWGIIEWASIPNAPEAPVIPQWYERARP